MKPLRPLLLAAVLVALSACRAGAPIHNVDDAPVVNDNKALSQDNVRQAIVRAGVKLGWQMKPVAPGLIIGTLHLRTHMAQVEIKYDTKKYAIRYKDSSNLDFRDGTIHKNYNGWVQNLDKGIQTQLNLL